VQSIWENLRALGVVSADRRVVSIIPVAVSSRAESGDLANAAHVTQVGEVLRSEPDWHIARDGAVFVFSTRFLFIHARVLREVRSRSMNSRGGLSACDQMAPNAFKVERASRDSPYFAANAEFTSGKIRKT
jgi:hypothetical protein